MANECRLLKQHRRLCAKNHALYKVNVLSIIDKMSECNFNVLMKHRVADDDFLCSLFDFTYTFSDLVINVKNFTDLPEVSCTINVFQQLLFQFSRANACVQAAT